MTIFQADTYPSGIVKSLYSDGSFSFSSVPNEFSRIKLNLIHNYGLYLDLNEGNFRLPRRTKDLYPHLKPIQDYLILEIDSPSYNDLLICDRLSKYKHIAYKTDTGVRCVLFGEYPLKTLQPTFAKLYFELKDLGELRNTILPSNYFEPLKADILLSENPNGISYTPVSYYEAEPLKTYKLTQRNFLDACKEYFTLDGFYQTDGKFHKDGRTYSWNPKYPAQMTCENPAYSKNIFKAVRKYLGYSKIENLDYSSDYEVSSDALTETDYKDICDMFIENKLQQVLAIRSYMGSNKSSMLEYIIRNSKTKVLFITSRISLAQEFSEKFKIPLYSDKNINTFKYSGSLICQYDSLLKINPNNYELIIIDEFVSVLFHSIDNLSYHKRELATKFLHLLKKKLVISDAFLNTEVLKILGRKITTFNNTKKDPIELVEHDFKSFMVSLTESIKSGYQISVSTNSVKSIENIIKPLCLKYDCEYIIITGPKSGIYKERTIRYLNKESYKKQILIYSPAVSLGVSIFHDIKRHYHYDTGKSMDPIQSIQMLRRSRCCESIHFCVRDSFSTYPLDFEALKTYLYKTISAKTSWIFDCGLDFEPSIKSIGSYYIQVQVLKNILLSDYASAFKRLLKFNFEAFKNKNNK